MQLAEEHTFRAPPGSPPNSAPRQAALLHGERALHQAVEMRPREALPRVMLLRNLMIQDHGREADVPGLALDALQELAAANGGDDISFTPAFLPAMQAVLLALKALWKLEQQALVPDLLAAASLQIPSMSGDFAQLAARVESQLCHCGPTARAELLGSYRYLSCIDLQFVNGRHHSGSPGLESVDMDHVIEAIEGGLCASGAA